jgi:hypothetical protein
LFKVPLIRIHRNTRASFLQFNRFTAINQEMSMAHRAIFPASESELIVFLSHLAARLSAHAEALGITNNELIATLSDIAYCQWVLQTWYPTVQQSAMESTAYKILVMSGSDQAIHPRPSPVIFENAPEARPNGVLIRLSNLIQRIKLSKGYSDAVGQDLDIITSNISVAHVMPEFSVIYDHSSGKERVKMLFTKYEHEGVSIESRRNGGEWESMGIATTKPWYDDRSMLTKGIPEVREYRLCWWDKNHANGEFTPVQKITVGP